VVNMAMSVVVFTPGDFCDQPELVERFREKLEELRLVAPKWFREFPGVDVTVEED
jgi:hypothetical protein